MFYSFKMTPPQPSSWIYYPTAENPSTRFKFVSIEINFNLDQMMWTRQTYSLLDWLGDLGGLYDALLHICAVFISPVSAFTLHTTLLTSFFRFKEKTTDKYDDDGKSSQTLAQNLSNKQFLTEQLRRDFQVNRRIPAQNWCINKINICNRSKSRHYRMLIKKSQSRIAKEMDLQKFLQRQRVTMTAVIGLLSRRQSIFVDKFSQPLIRESSNSGETSIDDELSDWRKEDMEFTRKMINSKD